VEHSDVADQLDILIVVGPLVECHIPPKFDVRGELSTADGRIPRFTRHLSHVSRPTWRNPGCYHRDVFGQRVHASARRGAGTTRRCWRLCPRHRDPCARVDAYICRQWRTLSACPTIYGSAIYEDPVRIFGTTEPDGWPQRARSSALPRARRLRGTRRPDCRGGRRHPQLARRLRLRPIRH
jgi:hypothetical protein